MYLSKLSLSVPYKKPKMPFDACLQLDTYISFDENICIAHTSTTYSHMLMFNGYVGYADYIKKLLSMHFYTNCTLN